MATKNPTNKQLQEQIAKLKFQNELNLHKLNVKLSETLNYQVPFDLINPFEQFLDGQKLLFPIFPSRLDYRTSSSYIWLSESQMDLLRAWARYMYETNPVARGIIEGIANFAIKTGYQYEVQAKRDENPDASLIKKAQRIIDDFCCNNKWKIREREMYVRSRRDGEVFVRIFAQDSNMTQVRIIEPECVRAPNTNQDYTFGIKTEEQDRETPLEYNICFTADLSNSEQVNANEMCHIKRRTDLGVKRGLSDLFCCQGTLSNVVKLLQASTQGEMVRQSIAYMRQYAQAQQDVVQAIQNTNTDWYEPEPTWTGTPRLQPVHKISAGSVVDIPVGLEFKNGPVVPSDSAIKIMEAGLQQLAAYFGVPSWLATGESSSASYASSLTEESPFSRMIETDQGFISYEYSCIMRKILEIAIIQDLLPQDTLDKIEVQVVCPSVVTRQADKQSQRYMLLHDKGVISKRTWTAKEDLNYEHEQQNRADDGDNAEAEQTVKPENPMPSPSNQPDSPIVRK